MRTVLWTGSKGWRDVDSIVDAVTSLRRPFRSIVGDADGFDALVWEVLADYSLPRWQFKAQWKQNGVYVKSAGHQRNRFMLDWLKRAQGTTVVAGWDGSSPGTKGCMDEARRRGFDVLQIAYMPMFNEED
jgi:hypothetical protein